MVTNAHTVIQHLTSSGLVLNQYLYFVAGFLLLMRVIAVTFCVTLAASLAARLGSTPMAAFQICLQVWLATSLADGLAVAGQVLLSLLYDFFCYVFIIFLAQCT